MLFGLFPPVPSPTHISDGRVSLRIPSYVAHRSRLDCPKKTKGENGRFALETVSTVCVLLERVPNKTIGRTINYHHRHVIHINLSCSGWKPSVIQRYSLVHGTWWWRPWWFRFLPLPCRAHAEEIRSHTSTHAPKLPKYMWNISVLPLCRFRPASTRFGRRARDRSCVITMLKRCFAAAGGKLIHWGWAEYPGTPLPDGMVFARFNELFARMILWFLWRVTFQLGGDV